MNEVSYYFLCALSLSLSYLYLFKIPFDFFSVIHFSDCSALIMQVWKDQEEYEERLKSNSRRMYRRLPTANDIVAIIEHDLFSLQHTSIICRSINANQIYQYFQVLCIVLTVCFEIASIDRSGHDVFVLDICQIVLQILFMLDVLFRVHGHYPNWKHYMNDSWNSTDFALLIVTMIPVATYGMDDGDLKEFFGLLRILRVLRILRLLNWIHDLNVSTRVLVLIVVTRLSS